MTCIFGDSRLPQRFWDKVWVNENGCWIWQGAIKKNQGNKKQGYGAFKYRGKTVHCHSFAYENLVDIIGIDEQPDHTCLIRKCCNPDHIELVSNLENTRRGSCSLSVKERCKKQNRGNKGHYVKGYVNEL